MATTEISGSALVTERRGWAVAGVYTATTFLSAALLFCVEPMFAKMVLPMLGGSSAVWSIAMVVFQALLLAGYVYAHLLMRTFGLRTAALVHVGLLCAAALSLPIGISSFFHDPPEQGIAPWLVGLFAMSIGFPFHLVAANGPLLQAWFARSDNSPRSQSVFPLSGIERWLVRQVLRLPIPSVIEPGAGPDTPIASLDDRVRPRWYWESSLARCLFDTAPQPRSQKRRRPMWSGTRGCNGFALALFHPDCWLRSRLTSRPMSRLRHSSGSSHSRFIC